MFQVYQMDLTTTSVKDLKPNMYVNVAGIVNQPLQPPKLTSTKSHYQMISIQGIVLVFFQFCKCEVDFYHLMSPLFRLIVWYFSQF